jgi:hypothetical protein
LNLNWEAHGTTSASEVSATTLTISLWYQDTTWVPIHTVTTSAYSIDRAYGWGEYAIPQPFADYIHNDEIKIRVELSHQLPTPQDWTQRLYLRWILLEVWNDVALNTINASTVDVLSTGFECTGTSAALYAEDAASLQFSRITAPSGESGQLQFAVEYNLGYYGMSPLFGLRFGHYDWCSVEGGAAFSYTGRIYIEDGASDPFLCLLRRNPGDPVSPDTRHAIVPLEGDWRQGQVIRLRFEINYTVSTSTTIAIDVDWAGLQIVREPHPIVLCEALNDTLYAKQTAWFNITCLDGKAPITEVRLSPWGDLIGNAAGSYFYSHYVSAAGATNLSLLVQDAEADEYTLPVGSLQALYRPIAITLYLTEDPLLQEFVIQLLMKDLLANTPLALYPFTKTIYKNGSWFRQQTHQTTPQGSFTIHESVLDYLDWNYTVTISTAQTPIYEATSVQSSIILSQCPPYLFINNVSYAVPLKANDQITLNYTALCQTPLQALWLYKNNLPFLPLPTTRGTLTFTFQDVGGVWEYRLYANNTRGFQGFSAPFTLDIMKLETSLQLESVLNPNDHAIILAINLVDEFNRSCPNVPLQITIHDFGKVFYSQEVRTGMDGAFLIIHFDQYLDHSFTIEIASESTSLYKGTLLTEGDLTYQGYPLYNILGIGTAIGAAVAIFTIMRRRISRR